MNFAKLLVFTRDLFVLGMLSLLLGRITLKNFKNLLYSLWNRRITHNLNETIKKLKA